MQQAPFFVLTGVEAPAILIEVGYISHPAGGRAAGARRVPGQLARAITEGVKAFLSELRKRDAQARRAVGRRPAASVAAALPETGRAWLW